MIPQTITAKEILRAVRHLDSQAVPARHKSTKYDLLYKKRRYPPKYVLSMASQFDSGKLLPTANFSGGDETNNFLIARGFTVVTKSGSRPIAIAPVDEDEESSFPEGKPKFRQHRMLERDVSLAKKAKTNRIRKVGRLECDACGFDFQSRYGPRGAGFIEAHHDIPVSQLKGNIRTKLSDLSLVCSNCHRMLHTTRPWLTVKQLRTIVRS